MSVIDKERGAPPAVTHPRYEITPRAEHIGGGWRLQLLEGEQEVGGGIYPVSEDCTNDDAHIEAMADGDAWLMSRGEVDEPETFSPPQEEEIMNHQNVVPTILGAVFEGGFYAGRILVDGVPYALIVAPKAEGEREDIAWLDSEKRVAGADSYSDGAKNTAGMLDAGSELAQWARGLDINGQTDWYIPSQDELEVLYRNLKPTTRTNSLYGRSGVNVSAVPPTYAYASDSPAQTQIEAFQEGGTEAFADEWYWSSTQRASLDDYAWYQYFGYGSQDYSSKSAELRARAVRRFAI